MKKHSKFIASAAAITVAVSAIAPVATEAASFSDIKGHTHENAIISLVDLGIINGYPDGTFKPNQSLSRSDVVKLLGKYLVSLGHKVPTDYKTKMRFTDLTAKSQDELLQYAALVKDVGVFNGSNGKLMHKDEIRRDQMATVLVRAFKVINDYDYIAHVKEQDYKSTITDITKTTAEHQEAINVFAYYGVTKQPTFSPKDVTKRGQFASFLFNMLKVETPNKTPEVPKVPEAPALTIKTVEVQANNKLRVVLSDDKAYIVTLKTPLVENIASEVSFEIGEKTYKTTVTYVVQDLKVASITNPNGGQIAITFNKPVKLDTDLNTAAINKLIGVTGVDRVGQVLLSKGQLSEDKRTLTVTINATTGLEGRYRVVVDGIESTDAKKLVKYDDISTFIADKTAPIVTKVENVSATKAKVIFSEPVVNPIGATTFTLVNGTVVSGITGTIERNATEVIYDLSAASANGRILDPGTAVVVKFGTILDLANNLSSPNPLSTHITKGNKDGVAPTLNVISQLGAKKFKLTFSEEVRELAKEDIAVAQNLYANTVTNIEKDTTDAKSYIITTANPLNGYTTVSTAPGRFVTDLSGEVNVFSTAYNFIADTSTPSVVNSIVVKDKGIEYLEFTFDRNVTTTGLATVKLKGNQILNGITYPIGSELIGQLEKSPNKDNALRLRLSSVFTNAANIGAVYSVSADFTNVTSEFGQVVNNTTNVNFVRGQDLLQTDEKLAVLRVETANSLSLGTAPLDNNTIIVTFNTNVDGVTAANRNNYSIQGVTILDATVKHNELNKVYLTIQPQTLQYTQGAQLMIQNLRALNSVVAMEPSSSLVYLNENISPTLLYTNVSGLDTITLTFSEAIQNVLSDSFIVTINNQQVTSATTAIQNNQVMIRLGQPLQYNQQVTVTLKANAAITDLAKNTLQLQPIQFTVPYSINF